MKFTNGRSITGASVYGNELLIHNDLNNQTYASYNNLTNLIASMVPESISKDHVIINGLTVKAHTAMTLRVSAGMAVSFTGEYCLNDVWGFSASAGDIFSILVPEYFSIGINTADPTLNRRDIIEIRPIERLFEDSSRQFRDPITGIVSSSLASSKKEFYYEFQVIDGTPASVPVAPSATSGWIKLAEIYVGAAVTSITENNIFDFNRSFSWTTDIGLTVPNEIAPVSSLGLFARWDMDDIPDIPTEGNSSNVVYYTTVFDTDGNPNWQPATGNDSIMYSGILLNIVNYVDSYCEIYYTPLSFTRNELRLKLTRNNALTLVQYYNTVASSWTTLEKYQLGTCDYYYIRTPTTTNTELRLRFTIPATTIVEIQAIYLGSGKYAPPAFFNNSTENVPVVVNACKVQELESGINFGYAGVHQYWNTLLNYYVPDKLWLHAVQTAQFDALEKSIFGTYSGGASYFKLAMIAGALRVRWYDGTDEYMDIPDVKDGTHDFFIDFTTGIFKLYVNGLLHTVTTLSGIIKPPDTVAYWFGFIYGGLSTSVKIGTDKFVRMYTRELTASEVLSLHLDPRQGAVLGIPIDRAGSYKASDSNFYANEGSVTYKPVEVSIPAQVGGLEDYIDTYPLTLNTGVGFTAAPVRVAHDRFNGSAMYLHNGTTSHIHAIQYANTNAFKAGSLSLGSAGSIPAVSISSVVNYFYYARITGGTTIVIGCVFFNSGTYAITFAERTLRTGVVTATIHSLANISSNRYAITYVDGGVEYVEIFDDDTTTITVYGSRYATTINAPTYIVDNGYSGKFILYTLTNYIWICANSIATVTQNTTSRLTSSGYAETDNTIIKISDYNTGLGVYVVVHRDPAGTNFTRIHINSTGDTTITVGGNSRFPLIWSSGDTRDTLFVDFLGTANNYSDFVVAFSSKGAGLSRTIVLRYCFADSKFYFEREGYDINAPASSYQVMIGTSTYNLFSMYHNSSFVNVLEARSEFRRLWVSGRGMSRMVAGVMSIARSQFYTGDTVYGSPRGGTVITARNLPIRDDGLPYMRRPPIIGVMLTDTEMKLIDWASCDK